MKSIIAELIRPKINLFLKRSTVERQLLEANSYILETMYFVANRTGSNINDYYVGIADDIQNKLKYHKLVAHIDDYVYFKTSSFFVANETGHQLREMGMQSKHTIDSGRYIYCYRITSLTVQNNQ